MFLLTLLVWETMQRNQNKGYNPTMVIKPEIFYFQRQPFLGAFYFENPFILLKADQCTHQTRDLLVLIACSSFPYICKLVYLGGKKYSIE